MAGLTAPGRNGEFFRILEWVMFPWCYESRHFIVRVDGHKNFCEMMNILPFSFAS